MTKPEDVTKQATTKPDDLVYFRFGKQGAENHRKVREIVAARGGGSSIAGVIRELIARGLADLETEQAIISAHKGGGASAVVNAGG